MVIHDQRNGVGRHGASCIGVFVSGAFGVVVSECFRWARVERANTRLAARQTAPTGAAYGVGASLSCRCGWSEGVQMDGGLFAVEGKSILVTGGSRGIGLMIAQGFVEAGAR